MCQFVSNFLSYVSVKYYLNWFTVGKVITKNKLFIETPCISWHTAYITSVPCTESPKCPVFFSRGNPVLNDDKLKWFLHTFREPRTGNLGRITVDNFVFIIIPTCLTAAIKSSWPVFFSSWSSHLLSCLCDVHRECRDAKFVLNRILRFAENY